MDIQINDPFNNLGLYLEEKIHCHVVMFLKLLTYSNWPLLYRNATADSKTYLLLPSLNDISNADVLTFVFQI